MASEITLRSCSSKWVNNHMEVNDWPNGMEVAGANTTKAFMANKFTITMVIYRYWVHFLKSLNAPKHCSKAYVYFLTSMNYDAKTARISLFYFLTSINSAVKLLEYTSHKKRMSPVR